MCNWSRCWAMTMDFPQQCNVSRNDPIKKAINILNNNRYFDLLLSLPFMKRYDVDDGMQTSKLWINHAHQQHSNTCIMHRVQSTSTYMLCISLSCSFAASFFRSAAICIWWPWLSASCQQMWTYNSSNKAQTHIWMLAPSGQWTVKIIRLTCG